MQERPNEVSIDVSIKVGQMTKQAAQQLSDYSVGGVVREQLCDDHCTLSPQQNTEKRKNDQTQVNKGNGSEKQQ